MTGTRSKNISTAASSTTQSTSTQQTISMPPETQSELALLVKEMKQMSVNINSMRAESKNELQKISSSVSDLNGQISALTASINQVKKDISTTQQGLATLKEDHNKQTAIVDALTSHANQQQQKELAMKIAIYNLPKSLDKKTALAALNDWSSDLFSHEKIRRAIFVPSANNSIFQSAYISYWNERDRCELTQFIKAKQKDDRGRHTPILSEHIFKNLPADSPCKAVTINFQGQMTALNREIFNYLRNATSRELVAVYIGGDGLVNIKFSKTAVPLPVSSRAKAERLIAEYSAKRRPTQ
jgi:outer membrane murein-binding lipoprotein Lpp